MSSLPLEGVKLGLLSAARPWSPGAAQERRLHADSRDARGTRSLVVQVLLSGLGDRRAVTLQ